MVILVIFLLYILQKRKIQTNINFIIIHKKINLNYHFTVPGLNEMVIGLSHNIEIWQDWNTQNWSEHCIRLCEWAYVRCLVFYHFFIIHFFNIYFALKGYWPRANKHTLGKNKNFACRHTCLSVYVLFYITIYLSVYFPFHHLPIYLSISIFIYVPIHLAKHLI